MKQRLTWIVPLVAMLGTLVSCGPATTSVPEPSATAPVRTQGQVASGTVASVENGTLILTTAQGQVTVNVSPGTPVQKTVAGTLADLQEGQSLFVTGPQNADGIIVATSIFIRQQSQLPTGVPPGTTPRARTRTSAPSGNAPRAASGTLTRIVSNTLTLTTAQGPVTVNVGSNTSIQKTETGAPSDLQEGDSVTVVGPRDENGNIAATSIAIRPPRGQGAPSVP